jgi:hypothetical protein
MTRSLSTLMMRDAGKEACDPVSKGTQVRENLASLPNPLSMFPLREQLELLAVTRTHQGKIATIGRENAL